MKRSGPYKVPVSMIAPAALDADNTPAAIDLLGYDAATLLIHVGIGGITFDGSNKVEFKLTASNDNSSYTAVADADVVLGANCDASVGTGGIVYSLIAAHGAGTVTDVKYIGGKRYLKLLADFSGTHGSPTPLSATILKEYAHLSASA